MSEHDEPPQDELAREAAITPALTDELDLELDGADLPAHPLELALRHGMRYSGLRRVGLDPRLLLYLPYDVCVREVVLPLSVDDEQIEIATAFPHPDLSLLAARFPDLEIELVFAPHERIVELCGQLKAMAQ